MKTDLSKNWQLLHAMMNVVPIGMTYIAPDLEVQYANPSIKQFHGFNSESELVGRRLDEIFPPHVMDFIGPIINATLSGETVSFLGRTDAEGGLVLNDENYSKTYYFQTTYIPHQLPSEEIVGFIIIIEEITSLKRAELEVIEKNNYLETFAQMLAHDLKEPVRTIKVYGDILETKLKRKFDKSESKFLRYMIDSAQRLYDFIEGLRTFNAIDIANAPAQMVDLNKVIADVKQNLFLRIQETFARIESDHLPNINAHNVLMLQLFQNLISNGIKFGREEIVPVIRIGVEEKERFYQFSVKDNGIGIREDSFDVIFNLFSRLKHGKEIAGTGLGLAICKKIIKGYGGKIWVESEIGKGSIFYFTLPK